jgi:prepilin-type N-terminal cleavage/methylation domain-containing protein
MKKGFTLIELLIVVAIIAILAAIAVPNFLEAQVRSKVSRAKTDMRSASTAIEAYAVDNRHYPPIVAPTSPLALGTGTAINGPSVLHPGIDQAISSRFIWITTPIAYITSAFTDPFINASVKFAYDADNEIIPGYDTYDYVDA